MNKNAIKVLPNTDYYISVFPDDGSSPTFGIHGNNNGSVGNTKDTMLKGNTNGFNSGEYCYVWFRTWEDIAKTGLSLDSKIQLEIGTKASDYETPSKAYTYTANADGIVEGIKSLSPIMRFVCGDADISVAYHKSWGMQTEYDRFWDATQLREDDLTPRTHYMYGFAYYGWSEKNFYPKYDMQPTNARYMFAYFGYYKQRYGLNGAAYTMNLVERLAECRVTLDFSKCEGLDYAFQEARISHIGTIDLSSATSANNMLYAAQYVESVEKIITREDLQWTSSFYKADKLSDVKFEGIIGQDINFSACPLSRASIDNIFAHLKTFGTVWTETTKTEWRENADGTYSCDKVKVKFNEIPENVTEYKVAHTYGNSEGDTGIRIKNFNQDGEVEFDELYHSQLGDNSGFFKLNDVTNPGGVGFSFIEMNCTIYEGVYHEAPATPPSVTFKQTAVDAAYKEEEWDAKVQEAQDKGWTIKTA